MVGTGVGRKEEEGAGGRRARKGRLSVKNNRGDGERVWPERLPRRGSGNLRTKVKRLKKPKGERGKEVPGEGARTPGVEQILGEDGGEGKVSFQTLTFPPREPGRRLSFDPAEMCEDPRSDSLTLPYSTGRFIKMCYQL